MRSSVVAAVAVASSVSADFTFPYFPMPAFGAAQIDCANQNGAVNVGALNTVNCVSNGDGPAGSISCANQNGAVNVGIMNSANCVAAGGAGGAGGADVNCGNSNGAVNVNVASSVNCVSNGGSSPQFAPQPDYSQPPQFGAQPDYTRPYSGVYPPPAWNSQPNPYGSGYGGSNNGPPSGSFSTPGYGSDPYGQGQGFYRAKEAKHDKKKADHSA